MERGVGEYEITVVIGETAGTALVRNVQNGSPVLNNDQRRCA